MGVTAGLAPGQQQPSDNPDDYTAAPKKPLPVAPVAPVAGAPKAAAPMTAPAPAPLPVTAPAPTVAPPAAPVNRLELATKAFETMQAARAPGDKRALENVTSQAAGLGQLGSGQWRSALTNANNERQLQLDTARDELINKATEGSIADASTAYQQALAGSQLGLAAELGRANVDIGRGQLDLAKEGQAGSLGLEKERLDLAKEGQAASIGLAKEQFALTKQLGLEGLSLDQARAALDVKVRTGQLTLAEKDQALRELEAERANTRADKQLELAEGDLLGRVQTGVDEDGNPVYQDTAQAAQAKAQLALQTKSQELDELVRTGQLTLAQKDQALRELQTEQQAEQFRLTLAQNASQFGASQAQQLELAKLADATQNRQLDISTAQGKNTLLLELARIMGGPSGNVDPNFIRAMAAALGMPMSSGGTGGNVGAGSGAGTTGGTGGSGSGGQVDEGYGE